MKPYYEHAGVTIYCADCRDLVGSLAADALITDVPYGVNMGEGSDRRSGHRLVRDRYASYRDTPEQFDIVVAPAIASYLGLVRRGLVFCAGHTMFRLPAPDAVGGVFLPSARGRHKWGFASLSHCLLYGQAPRLNRGSYPTAISATEAAEESGHPCPKPLKWMKWAVGLASDELDVVVDPFMGSGTTLVAAKDMGRRAVGIEIEERYCEIAAKRLSQEVLSFQEAR